MLNVIPFECLVTQTGARDGPKKCGHPISGHRNSCHGISGHRIGGQKQSNNINIIVVFDFIFN